MQIELSQEEIDTLYYYCTIRIIECKEPISSPYHSNESRDYWTAELNKANELKNRLYNVGAFL